MLALKKKESSKIFILDLKFSRRMMDGGQVKRSRNWHHPVKSPPQRLDLAIISVYVHNLLGGRPIRIIDHFPLVNYQKVLLSYIDESFHTALYLFYSHFLHVKCRCEDVCIWNPVDSSKIEVL